MDSESQDALFSPSWRSSKALVVLTVCVAMFTESLLFGFLVPILPYMLEGRLHTDPSRTQNLTSVLLSIYGLVTLISSPFIASWADRVGTRKIPLLLALAVTLVGTVLIAFVPYLPVLYIGRIFQGLGGSSAWLLCLSLLTETAGEDVGKSMGLCMSFVMAGTVAGPMIGGFLLEWAGYTLSWIVPMGMLGIDIFCRLLIIDPRKPPSPEPEESHEGTQEDETGHHPNTENSPLLSSQMKDGCDEEQARGNFYSMMLRDPRILAGLATSVFTSAIVAGFNATWTVHLHRIFNWGPAQVGSVIFLYQIPLIFINPLAGHLRDRVGVRYPAVVGWALVAPLVWCLGIPGSHSWWVSPKVDERSMFVGSAIAIGVVQPLFQDGGLLNTLEVLQSIESSQPGIFGVYGGRSRVLAMNEISFNLGLLLGPLVTGSLSESIGYYYTNLVLATVCLMSSIAAFFLFGKKNEQL